MHLASQKALISAIVKAERDVSILVGSPLSMPDSQGSPGVPSVSGVLDILLERVNSENLEHEYSQETKGLSDGERYQAGFQFLRSWVGQDAVNDVVRQAVLKSRNADSLENSSFEEIEKDQKGWYIPSGTKALGEIVANHQKFSGPVLTTNFDPLVSNAINKAGCNPFQTVLDTDGSFNQHRTIDPDSRQIIHLHGYWHNSDTLHTPDQLTAHRPNLKASLSDLLSKKTLLVIGYGGWDDIFIDALKNLMFDKNSTLEVLWAFFEKEERIVETKYKKLLDSVQPAHMRGRFRAYGGIDCNKFFNELLLELNAKKVGGNQLIKITEDDPDTEKNTDTSFNHQEDPLGSGEISQFKKWNNVTTHSHQVIRVTEQIQFLDALKKDRIVNVVAGWGMGDKNFITAALKSEGSSFSEAGLYRLDLDNTNDKEGFLSSASEQLGSEIQHFITSISKVKGKVILLLDGIEINTDKHLQTKWQKTLSELASTFVEFADNLQIILCSIHDLEEIKCTKIHLYELDDADINSYIKDHRDKYQEPLEGDDLEAISRLSSGIPKRLDRILSDLRVLSISDLIEHDTPSSLEKDDNESVPTALKRTIDELKNAETEKQRRSFYLLQVLSVLAYGETFSNIKRFDHRKPFYPENLIDLHQLGLVEATSFSRNSPNISVNDSLKNRQSQKLQTVSPLVAEYVLSHISNNEVHKIVLRASELTFGQDWRNNKIKLSSAALTHIKEPMKPGPGNPHLLAKKLLRQSIEQGVSREVHQAFNISLTYCNKLLDEDRYRDVVSVATETLILANETSEVLPKAQLGSSLGKALRMIKSNDKALEVLERTFDNMDDLTKNEKGFVCLNLALLHESLGDKSAARKAARDAQDYFHKDSSGQLQAENIIISSLEKNDSVDKLKNLESKARKSNSVSVANNISLDLAELETDHEKKISYYDRVTKSEGDSYTAYRAIVRKASYLIKAKKANDLHLHERRLLSSAYNYLYMQRMPHLFNSAHYALWFFYDRERNYDALTNLFRYSSLIWRLQGNTDKEQKYAKQLDRVIEHANNKNPVRSHIDYALFRIKLLVR